MLNCTVPVGTPVPVTGATAAVNVIVWPRFAAGTRLLVSVVRLARRQTRTTCVMVAPVLGRYVASPPYAGRTGWLPTATVEVVNAAWPAPTGTVTGIRWSIVKRAV